MGTKALTILTIMWLGTTLAGAQSKSFVLGLQQSVEYSVAKDGEDGASVLDFQTKGRDFKAMAFYYQNGAVVSVEDIKDGRRALVVLGGKLNLKSCLPYTRPDVGVPGVKATYSIGIHDFTNDGFPALVIGIRDDAGDAMAVYILEYGGTSGWYSIGEMVTQGKGIHEARVFRQAVSFKDASSGVMSTWTYHEGKFDFLSSDHADDPSKLF